VWCKRNTLTTREANLVRVEHVILNEVKKRRLRRLFALRLRETDPRDVVGCEEPLVSGH
jgi:hypothetical protein